MFVCEHSQTHKYQCRITFFLINTRGETMNRLFLAVVIIMTGTSTSSGDLTWGFKSPSFHHGNGYSTHVLSVEQLQFNRKEDIRKEAEAEQERIERELDNTILNKFMRNLESRIYATLSKQMVDNMFAQCGEETGVECSNAGTTEIEDATIAWVRNPETGSITLTVDGPDGYTEITIPGAGEFNF